LLCDVLRVFRVEAFEEYFDLFVSKTKVESNDRVLEFTYRNSLRVIRIDHAKALVNRDIFVHKVLTDLFKDTAFPFYCILRFLRI